MARLVLIRFNSMKPVIANGEVLWEWDSSGRTFPALPQIFWESGEPWCEANDWALTRAEGVQGSDEQTVLGLMKHLAAYASWLELAGKDWRHFPKRSGERTINLFRGELIRQRDVLAALAPSTTSARMRAVLQFYRYAKERGFVSRPKPMWGEHSVIVRFFDAAGFERTMIRARSELAIPNRQRIGLTLEGGLLPITPEQASSLLAFTDAQQLVELHYMLLLGFLCGARFETVTTLRVRNVETAFPDTSTPGFHRLAVGPGTGVETKFDVSGSLLVPDFLIASLKGYAYSMQRLRRQALAEEMNRGRLFLTCFGNPYASSSFQRLMTDLRRRSMAAGMRFMQRFHFHRSRATYGTTVMELALKVTDVATATAFLRDAMLHKDESVTLDYVRFVQRHPVGALISKEFSKLFSGVANRDWSDFET